MLIKINEEKLQNIISESIKKVLKEDFANDDEYAAQFMKYVNSREAAKTTIMQDIYDYYDAKYNNNLNVAKMYLDDVLEAYADAIKCKPSELNVKAIKKAINQWAYYNYNPEEY